MRHGLVACMQEMEPRHQRFLIKGNRVPTWGGGAGRQARRRRARQQAGRVGAVVLRLERRHSLRARAAAAGAAKAAGSEHRTAAASRSAKGREAEVALLLLRCRVGGIGRHALRRLPDVGDAVCVVVRLGDGLRTPQDVVRMSWHCRRQLPAHERQMLRCACIIDAHAAAITSCTQHECSIANQVHAHCQWHLQLLRHDAVRSA